MTRHPADGLDRHPDETDEMYDHRKDLVVVAAQGPPVSPQMFKWLHTGDPEEMPDQIREKFDAEG